MAAAQPREARSDQRRGRLAGADVGARPWCALQDLAWRVAGHPQDRFRHCARRARRHRRRERLRQDHHRAFDPAVVAEQSCRAGWLDPFRRDRSCRLQRPRDARHPRPAHRHDLSGADERARSGLHRRASDCRDVAHPYRRERRRGAGQDARHAAAGRHRFAGAAHRRLSASALRRHAPARDDCGCPDLRAAAPDRGRADHRARRHRAGANPGIAARAQRDIADRADADHARSRRRGRDLHADDHDVCGRGDRGCRRSTMRWSGRCIPTRRACCARCRI